MRNSNASQVRMGNDRSSMDQNQRSTTNKTSKLIKAKDNFGEVASNHLSSQDSRI